jgi:hypothetical protein
MLKGMNIPGVGVVGTTVTGSQALRLYANTRTLVANGSAGALANFLVTSTNITGQGGGFIGSFAMADMQKIFLYRIPSLPMWA